MSKKAKVKWKTSKKSVVSITKKKGNTVTLKAKKKGTAVVTATYNKKKYKCRITVKAKKKPEPVADDPVLNSRDVALYYLSEEYKDYITYDSSHLREYRFRVSGTKYISTTSDYELYNDRWADIFLKGKGDCMASRYAVQVLCNHMGIKALVCRSYDAHGQTLVFADGKFYVIVTGYNEPKPRSYSMYEISGAGLEKLAEENLIDLNYFYQ